MTSTETHERLDEVAPELVVAGLKLCEGLGSGGRERLLESREDDLRSHALLARQRVHEQQNFPTHFRLPLDHGHQPGFFHIAEFQ